MYACSFRVRQVMEAGLKMQISLCQRYCSEYGDRSDRLFKKPYIYVHREIRCKANEVYEQCLNLVLLTRGANPRIIGP